MKIMIIRNAFRNDFGGAETYAYNLGRELMAQQHKVLVVSKLRPLLEKCRSNGVPAIWGPWDELQGWRRAYYLRNLMATLWYSLQILAHRIDIVNPQGRDDFIFATNAAHLLRKRVVWTDHGDLKYILNRAGGKNSRMQSWIIDASRKASAIVCVSQSEKEEIERVAPELTNLVVVHNGVFAPDHISPVARPAGNRLIIGTNARLVKAKGVAELLTGFAHSELTKKDVLWIIGSEGSDRQTYYDMADKLGIRPRVKFWGYVTNPNDYVATMDIFVHASYHEAFSLAIIEAAMLGKPIIATAVGGTPEIIDASCGILIQPRSSKQISDALNALSSDPVLRERLGSRARKKAAVFNLAPIVRDQLLPIYEEES